MDSWWAISSYSLNYSISVQSITGIPSTHLAMYPVCIQEPESNESVFSYIADIIFEDSHARTVVKFCQILQCDNSTMTMLNHLCQCDGSTPVYPCAGYLATDTLVLSAHSTEQYHCSGVFQAHTSSMQQPIHLLFNMILAVCLRIDVSSLKTKPIMIGWLEKHILSVFWAFMQFMHVCKILLHIHCGKICVLAFAKLCNSRTFIAFSNYPHFCLTMSV